MTKAEQNKQKAKEFIENTIEKSRKDYKALMLDLEEQLEKWKDRYRELSYKNVFDLSDEQYERKNYLDALIVYSELLLSKHKKFNKKLK
jgi:hypothetical protein